MRAGSFLIGPVGGMGGAGMTIGSAGSASAKDWGAGRSGGGYGLSVEAAGMGGAFPSSARAPARAALPGSVSLCTA